MCLCRFITFLLYCHFIAPKLSVCSSDSFPVLIGEIVAFVYYTNTKFLAIVTLCEEQRI